MPAKDKSSPDPQTQARGRPGKRIARHFALTVCLLLLLSMCSFWLISNGNTHNQMQQQADLLGRLLAQQTATQVTELVLANDLISMNVVLSSLTRSGAIAEVRVLNADQELIASASGNSEPPSLLLPLPLLLPEIAAEYQAAITLADAVAGYVRVRLDLSYIEVAAANNLLLLSAATLLLMVVAALLTSLYYQYLVSFPANLLAFSLSNIRQGKIDTLPEPKANSELGSAIRQYNATAEFLAQNTFLDNFGERLQDEAGQRAASEAGEEDVTLLAIQVSNFQYLASTLQEATMTRLLNKYYFFASKVSQLYSGRVCHCSDGEVIINFGGARLEEEQAFFAICAGQLFLQLVEDLTDIGTDKAPTEKVPTEKVPTEKVPAKFSLAVHSGEAVTGLYSPVTLGNDNLMGSTLDQVRELSRRCPDNAMLISDTTYTHAGGESRVSAEPFSESRAEPLAEPGSGSAGEAALRTWLAREPVSSYRLLLERQAIQLVALYVD